MADFDVRLILADGDEVKEVHTYGRPRGAVEALHAYTWMLVEEGRPALALAIAEAEKSKRYREDVFLSRWVYRGKPGEWNVTFEPGRTDSNFDCYVNLKKKSAKCRAHFE